MTRQTPSILLRFELAYRNVAQLNDFGRQPLVRAADTGCTAASHRGLTKQATSPDS
jgi:hypothetical protein